MGNALERAIEEEIIKKKNFNNIKNNLLEYTSEMNTTVNDIEDWDELLNIKDESPEEKEKIENSAIKKEYVNKLYLFQIFGVLFCIFQLISVQSSIIIISAIFNEIIDGILLYNYNTKKENNFYEYIEISSYKEIPEIDIGMVTTTIGIIFHKKFGYYCSNITFQLIVSIVLFLFVWMFDFHVKDQLLISYNLTELVVLCIVYIFLSIIVGFTSAIGLKEYYDLYHKYSKAKIFGEQKDNNCDLFFHILFELLPSSEKTIFYFYPGISLFITIIINRKIFISFSDMDSKLILYIIVIIYTGCIVLSNIFYSLYLKPIGIGEKNKIKRKMKFEKIKEARKNINNGDKNKSEEKKEIILYTQSKEEKEDDNINVYKEIKRRNDNIKIEQNIKAMLSKSEDLNRNLNINKEVEQPIYKELFIPIKKNIEELSKTSKEVNNANFSVENVKYFEELENIRIEKNSYNKNTERIQEITINKIELKSKNYSTKVCTLCGYIYFQKTIGNRNACICYYYTGCKSWFLEKYIKRDVLIFLFLELLLQACNVGFNSILSEKLLNVYSFEKIRNFFITLLIISLFFGIAYTVSMIETENLRKKKRKKSFLLIFSGCFLFSYSIFIFISSICYIVEDNLSRKRWDNIIMASFIFFKSIDLQILCFFDFYDNTDIFNETLGITAEKVFWMLVETIIDSLEIKKKYLVIAQIVFSTLLFIYICCSYVCLFK